MQVTGSTSQTRMQFLRPICGVYLPEIRCSGANRRVDSTHRSVQWQTAISSHEQNEIYLLLRTKEVYNPQNPLSAT